MSDASDLDTGEAIRQTGAPAIPDDWRPWRVNEITEEVARLRDLARRVRLQPESAKRVATQWLQPSRDELAALTRWYNGASVIESRGALAADLHDAVKLVAKATTPEQWADAPEAMAARLEHFAESLDPQLRRWLSELQRTPEEKQAMTAASLEYIRARRIGGVVPKYATAELRSDPIRAMLRAGDEMGKLEKAIVRSRDLHGGLANATCTRIEAAWLRARNLLVRVVDDAAALVVASRGNPAPLFMAAETVKQGQAGEFVQQWPAVATALRTAGATRERAAGETPTDYVTLLQCSALVNRAKRTLERWKTDDTAFPTPDILGRDGTADEWSWATIRPYLEKKAKRQLPEVFPAHAGR